jgi:hypothetical protein
LVVKRRNIHSFIYSGFYSAMPRLDHDRVWRQLAHALALGPPRSAGDVAPAYDMVPMLYAPEAGHLTEREFMPPVPDASVSSIWDGVSAAAEDFWNTLTTHPALSPAFRAIAERNRVAVARVHALGWRLP